VADPVFDSLLKSLPYVGPTLLAYTIGIIIVLMKWSRSSKAALLTLLALVMMLVVELSKTILWALFIQDLGNGTVNHSLFDILRILETILDPVAVLLIVCAVFVGRSKPVATAHEEDYGEK
jgi:hypothetical protein